MSDPGGHLRLHEAPPDLLARAVADAARGRRPRAWPKVAVTVAVAAAAALAVLPPRPEAPAEDRVPVRLVVHAPEARQAAVAGTWNHWDASATPMQAGGDGLYYAIVELPRGRHEYMFVLDGERWVADEAAPLTVSDEFGLRNAVLEL